jgi:type I site-specific restriction endonuclease
MPFNQNPEQIARDQIDKLLLQSGWDIKNKNQINFHIGKGQTVQEYQTDTDSADYILFVGDNPGGEIEAKAEQHGHKFTSVEEHTAEYAAAKLNRAERLSQTILQCAFSGQLIGEINSDALLVVDTVSPDWVMAAKSNDKYQINL